MRILLATSAFHLSTSLPPQSYERVVRNRFPDGELRVSIDNLFPGQSVTLVASLQSPADNIVELLLILNVLERARIRVNLIITYIGYARHDASPQNESLGVEFIAKLLQQCVYERLTIVHPHSLVLERFLSFISIVPYDFFCQIAYENNVDIIVAPDQGAQYLANAVAARVNKQTALLQKSRINDKVHYNPTEDERSFKGQKVLLVDDIIVTGNTIISAAQRCKSLGADAVIGAVTHGLYSSKAFLEFEKSSVERVYSTNTIAQTQQKSRFIVLDITPYLVHSMMID
jgi:ribose-phosphate pyrophosphokinase